MSRIVDSTQDKKIDDRVDGDHGTTQEELKLAREFGRVQQWNEVPLDEAHGVAYGAASAAEHVLERS